MRIWVDFTLNLFISLEEMVMGMAYLFKQNIAHLTLTLTQVLLGLSLVMENVWFIVEVS